MSDMTNLNGRAGAVTGVVPPEVAEAVIRTTWPGVADIPPLAGLTGGTSNLAIDNSAKLNFPGTGTSLIAGQTLSTTDDRWLGHVGAEQKLFGGVSITGSISETAEGYAERSLKAGYKYRW